MLSAKSKAGACRLYVVSKRLYLFHFRSITILGFASFIELMKASSSLGEIITITRFPDLIANLFIELAGDARILLVLEIFEILEILILEWVKGPILIIKMSSEMKYPVPNQTAPMKRKMIINMDETIINCEKVEFLKT